MGEWSERVAKPGDDNPLEAFWTLGVGPGLVLATAAQGSHFQSRDNGAAPQWLEIA